MAVKILKSLLLASIFLFCLISCDNDNDILQKVENNFHEDQHSILTKVNKKDIPNIISYIEDITNGSYKISLFNVSSRNTDTLELATIHTDTILQVTDDYNISNYTFNAEAVEAPQVPEIINFIVSEYDDGSLFSYIIQYKPETNWYNSLNDGFTLDGYTGDILLFTDEGVFVNKTSFSNAEVTFIENRSPCDPSSGSGSGGGGSGGGSSGGGSGTGGSSGGSGTGGGSGGGGGPNITIICGCAPGHVGGNQSSGCNCTLDDIIILQLGPTIIDLFRGLDPCDPVTDPCERTNGDPCGNGTVGVVSLDNILLNRECNKLAALSNSTSFQSKMQELLNNVDGNTEIGYWGRMNGGNYSYSNNDRFESDPGVPEIRPQAPNGYISSYIHNHFNDGTGSLPFFSPGDLFTLFGLYNGGYISDLDDFVMVVATPGNNVTDSSDDTVYAITVSSPSQFAQAASLFGLDISIMDGTFKDQNFPIKTNISLSVNERNMAKLLKENNLGLTLFRGDKNDLSSWTRLKSKIEGSSVTVKEKDCN